MEKFTPICQRYTDVVAHKHFLQHYLFHRVTAPTVLVKLTSVIIKLQILANSLQAAQVSTDLYIRRKFTLYVCYVLLCIFQMDEDSNGSCVKFTPSEYQHIYYSRIPVKKSAMDDLNAICLLQRKTINWQNKTDLLQ